MLLPTNLVGRSITRLRMYTRMPFPYCDKNNHKTRAVATNLLYVFPCPLYLLGLFEEHGKAVNFGELIGVKWLKGTVK